MNQTFQLTREISYRGEKADINKFLQNSFENQETHLMPEIKISFDGIRLSANTAAEKFLQWLGIQDLQQMRAFFLNNHRSKIKQGINKDFEISNNQFVFNFTAVAFDEAEYVGLYCYRITKKIYQ